MTEADRPILYSFRRCPYAMRARMAIAASGIGCTLREVVLRDKPQAMLSISPKGTVPVLQLPDGRVLEESLDIMHWALGQHDPDGWLQEGEPKTRDALIHAMDADFKGHLDRYKYPTRYDNVDPLYHRGEAEKFLITLNDQIGDQPYLFGPRISMADIALFPFIRQFANTNRDWFNSLPLPALQRWLENHLESDLFLSVMQKYPQWHPGEEEPCFPANHGLNA